MSTGSVKTIAVTLLLASTALAAEPLRTVHDVTRNHTWVLQPDGVYLHGKRFELPGWIYAGEPHACGPALAIDDQGRAVVSSDIVPILWRIDPLKSQVTTHQLVLDADTDKDVGFSSLTYAADQGVFFAVSSVYGSLWRIDPLLRRAQKIPLSAPVAKACELAVERTKTRRAPVLVMCPARTAENGWSVHLTPDQRSAYVFARFCAQENTLQSKLP